MPYYRWATVAPLALSACLVQGTDVSGAMAVRLFFAEQDSIPSDIHWSLHEAPDAPAVQEGDQNDLVPDSPWAELQFSDLAPGIYGIRVEAEDGSQRWRGECVLPLDRFQEAHGCQVGQAGSMSPTTPTVTGVGSGDDADG